MFFSHSNERPDELSPEAADLSELLMESAPSDGIEDDFLDRRKRSPEADAFDVGASYFSKFYDILDPGKQIFVHLGALRQKNYFLKICHQ